MSSEAMAVRRPLIGASRWDAWVGDAPSDHVAAPLVGLQVERSLGPHDAVVKE